MVGYIFSQINQVWGHVNHNCSTLIFILTFVSKTDFFTQHQGGVIDENYNCLQNRTYNMKIEHGRPI